MFQRERIEGAIHVAVCKPLSWAVYGSCLIVRHAVVGACGCGRWLKERWFRLRMSP
jgi:hypothetical protein